MADAVADLVITPVSASSPNFDSTPRPRYRQGFKLSKSRHAAPSSSSASYEGSWEIREEKPAKERTETAGWMSAI